MQKIVIHPKGPLSGRIRVSGAKNAALPILAATLLADSPSELDDLPSLSDVENMLEILRYLGADIQKNRETTTIDPHQLSCPEIPYKATGKLRASFLVAGPLLAKHKKCRIALPGGCQIGTRPIDLHLKGFAALGAAIDLSGGFVTLSAPRLSGARIYLDFPSVGATENIMMAASLADGETVIENAAAEPEISDLAVYLSRMGAQITGAGTDTVRIAGVSSLSGAFHRIIPDRIEAGTFMIAAAITGGKIHIENVIPSHLTALTAKMREMGVRITEYQNSTLAECADELFPTNIKTLPYPGFPTDMQSQLCALMSRANGTGIITETVFENRFMHVSELKRMGADITIEGRAAIVKGQKRLTGAEVTATDLRAGAALLLAGLSAEGTTVINEAHHIFRGYDRLEKKLNSLGANVQIAE